MYQPFVSSAKNKKYSVYVKSTSGHTVTPELCLNMCRAYATHADKLQQKKDSRQRNRQSHTDYMRQYQHRPGVKAYRQQYEKDNADRRKARARELYAYQCSWGGDKAYHNNMLSIEPTLFT